MSRKQISPLEGEVRSLYRNTENLNKFSGESVVEHVWTFRLERYQDGERLPPVPVEMRGRSFTGAISEGDTVRLEKTRWREGETVHTTRVYNVTLKAPVMSQKGTAPLGLILFWLGLLLIVGFIVFATIAN